MQPLTQRIDFGKSNSHTELGYNISDSAERQKKALYRAFELVRKAKQTGAEMRSWILQTEVECRKLVINLKKKRGQVEDKIWNLGCLENRIAADLRTYMNSMAEIVSELKPLNPPLKTDQLRPFAEAILADRRLTVDSMSALMESANSVTAYKVDLQHKAPPTSMTYLPPA